MVLKSMTLNGVMTADARYLCAISGIKIYFSYTDYLHLWLNRPNSVLERAVICSGKFRGRDREAKGLKIIFQHE